MMTKPTSFKPVHAHLQTLADLFLGFPLPYVVASGSTTAKVSHIAPLDIAGEGAFAFLSNAALREQLKLSCASVVVLTQNDYDWLSHQQACKDSTAYVTCTQPYAAYAFVAQRLYLQRQLKAGVHASAVLDDSAQVAASAQIDARVVIGARARIGDRVHVRAGVVIGDDVVVGDDSTLYPNVTIYDACEVGARAIVHAGVVIGSDGFGFAPSPAGWHKIPQVGRVLIGDDVEIGANTTIDRGALADTVIHEGVKLDNQIQIAHNCVIGAHTVWGLQAVRRLVRVA